MENKRYYPDINIARGIASLLVVAGHAQPKEEEAVFGRDLVYFIHDFCYSFHMAVFFVLAGFVAYNALAGGTGAGGIIAKRAKRLLIPYAFYSFVTVFLKQIFDSLAYNSFDISQIWQILLGKNPNGGMWYLWTLFVISLIFVLLSRIRHDIRLYIAAGIIFYALYIIFPGCMVANLLKYVLFYALGVALRPIYDRLSVKLSSPAVFVPPLLILPVLVYFFDINAYLYPVTALLGIIWVLGASAMIAKKSRGRVFKFFNEMGNYSYDIYLLSYFVQVPIRVVCYTILGFPYLAVSVMMLVFGALAPYLISKYIVRKSMFLSAVLVGKFDR